MLSKFLKIEDESESYSDNDSDNEIYIEIESDEENDFYLEYLINSYNQNQDATTAELNEEYSKLKTEAERIHLRIINVGYEEEIDENHTQEINSLLQSAELLLSNLEAIMDEVKVVLNDNFHSLYIRTNVLVSRCYHSGYEYLNVTGKEADLILFGFFKRAIDALNQYDELLNNKRKIKIDSLFLKEICFAYNIVKDYTSMIYSEKILQYVGEEYEEMLYEIALKYRGLDLVSLDALYPAVLENFNQRYPGYQGKNNDFIEKCRTISIKLKDALKKPSPNCETIIDYILVNKHFLTINMITRPVSVLFRRTKPLSELHENCSELVKSLIPVDIDKYIKFSREEIQIKLKPCIELLEKIDIQIFSQTGEALRDLAHAITFMQNYLAVYSSALRAFVKKSNTIPDKPLNDIEVEIKSIADLIQRIEMIGNTYEKISPWMEEWLNEFAISPVLTEEYTSVYNRIENMRKLNEAQRHNDNKTIERCKELLETLQNREIKMQKLKAILQQQHLAEKKISVITIVNDCDSEEELLASCHKSKKPVKATPVKKNNTNNSLTVEEKQLLKIEDEVFMLNEHMKPTFKDTHKLLSDRLKTDEALCTKKLNIIAKLGESVSTNTTVMVKLYGRYNATASKVRADKLDNVNYMKAEIEDKLATSQQCLVELELYYKKISELSNLSFFNKCVKEGKEYILSRPGLNVNIDTIEDEEIAEYGQDAIEEKAKENRKKSPNSRSNHARERELFEQQREDMKRNKEMIEECLQKNSYKK